MFFHLIVYTVAIMGIYAEIATVDVTNCCSKSNSFLASNFVNTLCFL